MSMDYSKVLSRRVTEIEPSGIRRFFDLLDNRKDAISLTVGQPDFITPWHIRAAAIESLEQGKTYYTSNSGLTELRRGISRYLARRFEMHYDPKDEMLVTVGGSEAIDLAIRGLVNPGDEVITRAIFGIASRLKSPLAHSTPGLSSPSFCRSTSGYPAEMRLK